MKQLYIKYLFLFFYINLPTFIDEEPNLIPKLKDDAPQWVVDSYNHYMQQLREEFSDREWNDEKEEYVDKL